MKQTSKLPIPKQNGLSQKTILANKLKFDKHIGNIYQQASRNLNAITRLTNYMALPKNAF